MKKTNFFLLHIIIVNKKAISAFNPHDIALFLCLNIFIYWLVAFKFYLHVNVFTISVHGYIYGITDFVTVKDTV